MADAVEATGSCLCGQVKVDVKRRSPSVGACHCSMCRKWGGGPFLATDCGTEVSFDGENMISVFNSSDWAERGFCKNCGTHLFYRLKQNGQHMMPIGLFDSADGVVFDHQVFIEEKPAFYDFANNTENMTGAEVFEKFAPPSE